jgi:hypothetical protein
VRGAVNEIPTVEIAMHAADVIIEADAEVVATSDP